MSICYLADRLGLFYDTAYLMATAKNKFNQPSPLAQIVARIKREPLYGEKLAQQAGIVTKTGRLTKTYR